MHFINIIIAISMYIKDITVMNGSYKIKLDILIRLIR